MNRFKLAWQVTLLLGVALVLVGFVVPMIQVPGTIFKTGPGIGSNETEALISWTDLEETPPIGAGQSLNIQASESGSGTVTLQIVQQDPSGNLPDAYLITLDQTVPTANLTIPVKYFNPFVLLITSYNSTYSVSVRGDWVQFYQASLGIYWGATLVFAGLVMLYYYRIVERREAVFRKAMEDATKETA